MSRMSLSIPAIALAGLLLAPMSALSGPSPGGPRTPFDFNKDTKTDLAAENLGSGVVRTNMIDGITLVPPTGFPVTLTAPSQLVGAGSFDGSGAAQLVAVNSTNGVIRINALDSTGTTVVPPAHFLSATLATGFQYAGSGDFDMNGTDDLLFVQTQGANTGLLRIILLNSDFSVKGSGFPATLPSGFVPFGVGDVNGDGHADIAAMQTTGANTGLYRFFLMNNDGLTVASSTFPGSANAGSSAVGLGYLDNDSLADVLSIKLADPNKGLARVQKTASGGGSFSGSTFPFSVPTGFQTVQTGLDGTSGEVFTRNTSNGNIRVFILSADASSVSSTGFPFQYPTAFTSIGNTAQLP